MNPPLQFGKYAVTEILGKGAMGIVYKAFDPNIRRAVAIKTIRKELMDDDRGSALVARFRHEAQAAGRLSHPGIVGVYEYGEDDDIAYIAMEYVQGNPLREYFNRGTRFEERDAVAVMAQLLEALAYAHEQGVWHRDVKPANIIIMLNGKLKIADFGIARIDSSSLTQTGAVMGTPGYMAPEQYAGQAVDWRADLFSAGVVFYQLLTGARPFSGRAETVAFKICYENPPAPSQLDATRGWERFDPVIATALAKKPADRYQTAAEFRAAILEAYAAPVSPAVSEETIITEPTQPIGVGDASSPPRTHPSLTPVSATGTPPTGWDAAALKQVEERLARIVGPVARVLVKRAAQQTTDLHTLYGKLAEGLPTAQEREAFLASRPATATVPPPPPRGTIAPTRHGTSHTMRPPPAAPLTPEAVEHAAKALAPFLGPIARVVAKQISGRTRDRAEFHQLLAAELATEDERQRFLRAVGG
ncbi:MAG: serine/threonine protein kinase [Burkholderiales bacterium]|nr:serine/threonine protein kinase [Burkholderiales bacterium]